MNDGRLKNIENYYTEKFVFKKKNTTPHTTNKKIKKI